MNDMRVTFIIMGLCLLVLLLQIAVDATEFFALTPTLALGGMYWQFVTYMFAHGSISHFGVNMIGLFIFGGVVERVLGARSYIMLYFTAGLGAAVLHLVLTGISEIPMLGASGSVFGVLTAYAVLYPKNWIWIFPGIPMPAALLVVVFAGIEFFSGMLGLAPGIANFGHLGGIVFGALFMLWWKLQQRKKESGIGDMQWVWEGWQ